MMIPRLLRCLNYQQQRCVSALYVTGDKAKESYSILHPYLDFKEKLQNRAAMEKNLKLRQLSTDFSSICKQFQKYQEIESRKLAIEKERSNIATKLKGVPKEDLHHENYTGLAEKAKKLREELKSLKENSYQIEDEFVHSFLRLPNILHQRTPLSEETLLYRKEIIVSERDKTEKGHLSHTDLIEFRNKDIYYLKDEAAFFDIYFPFACVDFFAENNFIQFTNPDFSRSIVLEAAGIDANSYYEVQEDVKESNLNLLHLTGGGSLISFLPFIAKLTIFPSVLPLRFVALGRRYLVDKSGVDKGLYTATQSNVIPLFIATKTYEDAEIEMEDTLSLLVDIYKKLNIHFRIVYSPAKELTIAESLRASIQVFSPFYSEYIEVGYLSHYGDFISKRLLFNITGNSFPHIVAGEVLDASRIIAILLENKLPLDVPTLMDHKNIVEDFNNMFNLDK